MKKTFDNWEDVTILINSCDLYMDAWYPFFKLLSIQWPDCSYNKILNTETITFHSEFPDVKTICTGKGNWSQRLIKCLEQVETEFVLFFLEDQFLREPVNVHWFDNTVDFMRENKDVGVIFVRHTEKQKLNYKTPYFSRDEITDKFRIVGLTALYRKDYLLKILRPHENPWEFEKYASIRSKRYPEKVLQYSKEYPPMFVFDDKIEKGYGITQRKWLPKNKELFEKYNIHVNFENLGWFNLEEDKLSEKVVKIQRDKSQKKSLREHLYKIKNFFKVTKRKVNKKMKEIRSMI